MRKTLTAVACIVGLSVCIAQDAERNVSDDAVSPEIVITALRQEKDVNSIPYSVYRTSSESVQVEKTKRTPPDVFAGIPSIMIQKTSYGQGSPYLRGFTGFRTLFLIDGIRLNNSVFRDGPNQYWNTVDHLSVADYELVMGPSSVLYGSDAVGGAVNAIPVTVPAYDGAPSLETRLYYRGSSAERSNVGRVEVGGHVNESTGFIGGYSIKDFGDLRGGDDVGEQSHTGYSEMDFDARMDHDLSENSRLTIVHQSVDQDDAWRTHKTIYGIDWEGLSIGSDKIYSYDQNRDLTYVKYRGREMDGLFDGVEVVLSRGLQCEDLYRVKKDNVGERKGFDVETLGSALQLESDTSAGEVVCGVEYYHDSVDSYKKKYGSDGSLSSVEIQGPVGDDATYDSVGIYLQDTISVLDGGLDIMPGVRYNYCSSDADKVEDPITGERTSLDDDWAAVVGSMRFLYPLSEDRDHVMFAGISQGFRAPNLSDLTRLDIARSGELEVPVYDLDPEEYVVYETGLKTRSDKITAALTYYYIAIDSMIVRVPTGNVIEDNIEVTKKNSGNGYVHGAELTCGCDITENLLARLSASCMYGKVDAYPTSDAVKERDYMSRLMPPSAEISLRWHTEDSRYWAEAVCNIVAKADKLSDSDERDTQRIPSGGTPGYDVYTARAGLKIFGNIDLTLGVENILDEDYRIHGSGVNEPGRNFVIAANYVF